MTVYVDNARIPYGRMVMSHMIADHHRELVAMAESVGLSTHWIQDLGTHREHFDVSQTMRRRAIANGAVAITQRQLVTKLIDRREIQRRRDHCSPELSEVP